MAGMNPNNPNKNPEFVFTTPEAAIEHLETTCPAPPTKNLSDQEKVAIKTLASSHDFDTTEEFVGKRKKVVPYLAIREKTANKIIFTIRKMNNVYVAMATKDHPQGSHTVASYGSWKDFWEKLDEVFNQYAKANPSPKSSGDVNKLSPAEVAAVHNEVAKYQMKVNYVEEPGFVGNLEILSNWGSRMFALRKFEGMYYVYSAANPDKNRWQLINQFAYFHQALELLVEFVADVAQSDPNKLTVQQVNAIMKIASDNHFHVNKKPMEMEPDKHVVEYYEMVDPDGKVPFIVGRDNYKYIIWRTFGASWDKWTYTDDWEKPQITEHNGITIPEYNRIRDVVDSYGGGNV